MHVIENSVCWECKQEKDKLIVFDGLESWQDNAEICLDCLVSAQHHAHLTPETQASSQAVINAEALEQSDGDTPPAQAQVA